MKIEKKSQCRLVVLFVILCLLFIPELIVSTLHAVVDEDLRSNERVTLLGEMNISAPSYMAEDALSSFAPIELRPATDDYPRIMAEPSQVMVYVDDGDFEITHSRAYSLRKVMLYIAWLLVVIQIGLVVTVIISVIRGFRSGVFFTNLSVVLLRVLAAVYCVYSFISDNFGAMEQNVVKELLGDVCPNDFMGVSVLTSETIIVPVVILILAELINIAHRLNEEECATI